MRGLQQAMFFSCRVTFIFHPSRCLYWPVKAFMANFAVTGICGSSGYFLCFPKS